VADVHHANTRRSDRRGELGCVMHHYVGPPIVDDGQQVGQPVRAATVPNRCGNMCTGPSAPAQVACVRETVKILFNAARAPPTRVREAPPDGGDPLQEPSTLKCAPADGTSQRSRRFRSPTLGVSAPRAIRRSVKSISADGPRHEAESRATGRGPFDQLGPLRRAAG
jgi:hypothetical protein